MGEFSLQRCNAATLFFEKSSQSHKKTEIATLSRRFAHDLKQVYSTLPMIYNIF